MNMSCLQLCWRNVDDEIENVVGTSTRATNVVETSTTVENLTGTSMATHNVTEAFQLGVDLGSAVHNVVGTSNVGHADSVNTSEM